MDYQNLMRLYQVRKLPAVFQRRNLIVLFEKPGEIYIAAESGVFGDAADGVGAFYQQRSGKLQAALDQKLLGGYSGHGFEQALKISESYPMLKRNLFKVPVVFRILANFGNQFLEKFVLVSWNDIFTLRRLIE